MKKKWLLYFWLKQKFNITEGSILPKWFRFIRFTFFPLMSLAELISKNTLIKYDSMHDVYKIHEIKFTSEFFATFGFCLNNDDLFKFIKKEEGMITIEKIGQNEKKEH